MSRHKHIKALDLDEELDDYDGDDYEDQDSNSKQLRQGTAAVQARLGTSIPVTDHEIEDCLWHYYYDVEKAVKYLTQKADKNAAPKNTKTENRNPHGRSSSECSARLSAAEFFKDCPWLDIPRERLGEILIEPLCPRGGLLGGSSSQNSTGKPSKLAALAATRRKKENDEPIDATPNSAVALLDRLGRNGPSSTAKITASVQKEESPRPYTTSSLYSSSAALKYPSTRRQNVEKIELKTKKATMDSPKPSETPETSFEPVLIPAAKPSTFAQTMFGLPSATNHDMKSLPSESGLLHQLRPLYFALPRGPDTEFDPFAGPSPDDVVLQAQKSKGHKAGKGETATEGVDGITTAVEGTAIADVPKFKSKNLDVLFEFEKTKQKPTANFVVIGHVDAGKSTLMGRLLYDLKVVDQRTLEKYRKEAESIGKSSFALAWVLDQGTDERSQGVTIDIGMNKFETDRTAFSILDAPGHRDFIPNMIAGASQADFAVLVIDASTGSFESGLKGQTKEHALLVRSMGVQRVVVAINKLDALSWSRDRFTEIQQQVSAFLTAAGFQSKNLAFLPCSGLTGDNIVRKVTDPKASWYDGPPLITLLESSEPFTRAIGKPLRLIIDDIFRGGVQNPLSISGRIDAGSVQIGDVIVVVPSNETAFIKGIEVDSQPSDWAVAGQNVIFHLADIEQKYLKTGGIICPPSSPVKPLKSFTMKVLAFEHILPMAIEVHRGRLHAPGKISKLVAILDKSTGQPVEGGKKKVKIVKPGQAVRVVVEVEEAMALEVGDRVVLRAGGQTVGAGLLE